MSGTPETDPVALARIPTALGGGEREVIALALAHGGLAVLDDRAARRCALSLGVTMTGTLGVLVRARLDGHLTRLGPLLDELHKRRFYLNPRTRTAALQQAGETP